MIKAAIFDMDGLLVDSERIIMEACIASAQQMGISYTQAQYVELIGRVWADSQRVMTRQFGSEAVMNQVLAGMNRILDERNHVFPLKAGVLPLLQYYREKNVQCAVSSSSPTHHITHRLGHAGVLDYFSQLTSGQEVSRGKPNPDIYLLALEKLGLHADECIAFEDSELGAQAAIAAGLRVIIVPDLKQPEDAIRVQCFYVAESLEHWLTKQSDLLEHC